MNKKGLSVVELIVAFVLCILVFVFIMQVVSSIEELYLNLGVKTELLNKQSLISEKLNEKLNDKNITLIKKCGNNCYTFIYKDNTFEKMEINETNNTFSFGLDVYNFDNLGKVSSLTMINKKDDAYNKGILTINLDIKNSIFESGKYLIKAYYQYSEDQTIYSDSKIDKPEIFLFGQGSYDFSVVNYKEPGWLVYYPNGDITINGNDVTASNILQDQNGNNYITYTLNGNNSITARRDLKKMLLAKEHILNLYEKEESDIYLYDGTGKYVYKGDNPNNYILIANKLFRILSLDIQNNYKLNSQNEIVINNGNKVLEDKYLLKVVSNNYLLDESGNLDIAYGLSSDTSSAWINGNNKKYMNTLINDVYLKELLNTGTGAFQIKNGIFNTGLVDFNAFNLNSSSFDYKRFYDEEGIDYNGDIGSYSGCSDTKCEPNAAILSLTDLLFASGNCTINLSKNCLDNNWVVKDYSLVRLITRSSETENWVLNGNNFTQGGITDLLKQRVTLYLDANLYILGDGTLENPYQLYNLNN